MWEADDVGEESEGRKLMGDRDTEGEKGERIDRKGREGGYGEGCTHRVGRQTPLSNERFSFTVLKERLSKQDITLFMPINYMNYMHTIQ